jgi:predicted regulator of Ras-like GTPase activity (Roadblock/LC7/MglB family)
MFEPLFSQLDASIPGLRAVSVVGNDGIEIEQYVKSQLAHDVLSAEMTGILRTLERLHGELDLGKLQEVIVRTDLQNIFIVSLSGGLYILLVTDSASTTGKARYAVQKITHKFSELL